MICGCFQMKIDPFYFRLRPSRRWISAFVCSHRIPRSGCFRISSIRRSSSAICSGVGSGSYPLSRMFDQTRCANSIRSERPSVASISAFKVFHGMVPSGTGGAFQPWKPSMNSSHRRWASSTRSSNFSFVALDRNFATDIWTNYSARDSRQGISNFSIGGGQSGQPVAPALVGSALRTPHSALA